MFVNVYIFIYSKRAVKNNEKFYICQWVILEKLLS